MIPVVLSGGSGTRLWPMSRTKFPKQFNEFFSESLQSATLRRLSSFGRPWVLTSETLRAITTKLAKADGLEIERCLYEPIPKNTAPAIAYLCHVLAQEGRDNEIVGIFPADHLIGDENVFKDAIRKAIEVAKTGRLVTLGLEPTEPATGYGYIQVATNFGKNGEADVLKFHEKPDIKTAAQFLEQGGFYWNAGIFIFKADVMIQHFAKHAPQIWSLISSVNRDFSNLKSIFDSLPSISVDYAIMEKLSASELACIPCDPEWSDLGSWDAIAEAAESVKVADTQSINSKNNFIMPYASKSYALVGVDDLIVVDTADALLICKKSQSQDVKSIVEKVKVARPSQVHEHVFEHRPWGEYEILRDEDDFKSKIISVDGGQQLSYQAHSKREEHWVVISGKGQVVLDDKVIPVFAGSYVHIPTKSKHRIRNSGDTPLRFLEVQLGSYFGEDDITRFADDYDRK